MSEGYHPTTGITNPGGNDVLYGRGGGTNAHPGNIKFRKLAAAHKLRYHAASRYNKPSVAREVVKEWRTMNPPGRFLTKTDPNLYPVVWHDVGDEKAREKASQCLRERNANEAVTALVQTVTATGQACPDDYATLMKKAAEVKAVQQQGEMLKMELSHLKYLLSSSNSMAAGGNPVVSATMAGHYVPPPYLLPIPGNTGCINSKIANPPPATTLMASSTSVTGNNTIGMISRDQQPLVTMPTEEANYLSNKAAAKKKSTGNGVAGKTGNDGKRASYTPSLCACDTCREKKTKCDGQQPCTLCKQKYMKQNKLTSLDGIDPQLVGCTYSTAKKSGPEPGSKCKKRGNKSSTQGKKKKAKNTQKTTILPQRTSLDGSVSDSGTLNCPFSPPQKSISIDVNDKSEKEMFDNFPFGEGGLFGGGDTLFSCDEDIMGNIPAPASLLEGTEAEAPPKSNVLGNGPAPASLLEGNEDEDNGKLGKFIGRNTNLKELRFAAVAAASSQPSPKAALPKPKTNPTNQNAGGGKGARLLPQVTTNKSKKPSGRGKKLPIQGPVPPKQKTKAVKKKASTTAKAKKKDQQPAKPKQQPQKNEKAAAPSARANRMQLKNAVAAPDAKSLLEEKKQILNHRRKLLAYVRMCRTAAEERVNNLSAEDSEQLEALRNEQPPIAKKSKQTDTSSPTTNKAAAQKSSSPMSSSPLRPHQRSLSNSVEEGAMKAVGNQDLPAECAVQSSSKALFTDKENVVSSSSDGLVEATQTSESSTSFEKELTNIREGFEGKMSSKLSTAFIQVLKEEAVEETETIIGIATNEVEELAEKSGDGKLLMDKRKVEVELVGLNKARDTLSMHGISTTDTDKEIVLKQNELDGIKANLLRSLNMATVVNMKKKYKETYEEIMGQIEEMWGQYEGGERSCLDEEKAKWGRFWGTWEKATEK